MKRKNVKIAEIKEFSVAKDLSRPLLRGVEGQPLRNQILRHFSV